MKLNFEQLFKISLFLFMADLLYISHTNPGHGEVRTKLLHYFKGSTHQYYDIDKICTGGP